jgi:hypothetical protein
MCKNTQASFNKNDGSYNIPNQYPKDYFGRFKIDKKLVESLINALKDDDVYN